MILGPPCILTLNFGDTNINQVKPDVMFAYIAPEAVYASSSALCVTYRAGVQPTPQLKLALTDFVLHP